ncbi:Hypothetical protein Mbur_1722 [Methanococcoides burtonii DSM 6242]|uniref:DUF2254 domain-containing protein n=1 Tax=Methanococcoides burtonii (strain DSM 6242 / NBRC 107633 / OCM 468 / ACE-M) TaxID=259564 RepID=Q12VB2_METBU|nr:Hypothetical protein Mbur_1722 [Methanococcoides burtonii DSM 6242]
MHTGINPDNARYMLSALIQSLAAVVAIVITLSLVAIQLSAQSYSSRVIDVYRKTPDIWILISIYTTTIFFGLGTIKIIGTNTLPINGLFSLESFIFGTYFLGFFCFICLIPYIWNTLALLNPSVIVQLLAEDITEDKISKTEDEKRTTLNENDPVLPIIDIIISSIMKYDHTTVRSGANAIATRANEILNKKNEENISYHICEHLERVSMLALAKKEEEYCFILLGSLREIGRNAAENKFEEATKYAVMALGQIGGKTAENEWEGVTGSVIIGLGAIGEKTVDNELQGATGSVIITLNEIGKKAAENKFKYPTKYAVMALGQIGEKAAENGWEKATESVIIALGKTGEKAAENKLEWATESVVISLNEIGKKAKENEWYDIEKEANRTIEIIKQIIKFKSI